MLTLDSDLEKEYPRRMHAKPTKTSQQLYAEILIREKIRRWEKRYAQLGYLLRRYYQWKGKI